MEEILNFMQSHTPHPKSGKQRSTSLITFINLSYYSTKEPCPTKWSFLPQFPNLYYNNKGDINLRGLLRALYSYDLVWMGNFS